MTPDWEVHCSQCKKPFLTSGWKDESQPVLCPVCRWKRLSGGGSQEPDQNGDQPDR